MASALTYGMVDEIQSLIVNADVLTSRQLINAHSEHVLSDSGVSPCGAL